MRSFYKQGSAVGEIVCTAATAPDTITVVWRNYGTVNIGPGFDLAPYLCTTTFKTSIDNGINSGSAQTTAGNYNGYTKKYVDIGKTGLNFDVTDLAVAPA